MAIECTYCEEKVNAKRGVYVKCTSCQDVKLCLDCFSSGASIAEHESDHPYELIDCGSFSIIDESWKAHEELALLEAIELYGIGSWTDIANAVETRTADECCERYLSVYVGNFFGRCTWNAIDRNAYVVQDHTCTHNQPLSPSLSLPEKHKIVDISREQQIRLGYMPKRDDFEREYDNDAEFLVSKLAVNANDDTDIDRELKMAHINMYTDKLRERFRRKRIVLEYNLVKLFFHMHPEENSDFQETQPKPLENNSHPNQNAPQDTTTTMTNAITSIPPTNANDLKDSKIHLDIQKDSKNSSANDKSSHPAQNTILNYFRRIDSAAIDNGDNSKAAPSDNSILSSYFSDLNKSLAEQDFNSMEKKLRIFCQFSSAEDHNRLIRNLAREKELKFKIKELIQKRKSGLKFHNNNHNSIDGSDSDQNQSKQSLTKKNLVKNSPSNCNEDAMEVDSIDTSSCVKVSPKKSKNESTKAILSLPLSQSPEPSWRLLSEGEKRLCKSSNLKPSQYITLKAFIMKEHSQKKKKGAAQRLFTDDIDKTVKRRIVDFLARNNWIKV